MIRTYRTKFGVDMYFTFHSREILKYFARAGTIVKQGSTRKPDELYTRNLAQGTIMTHSIYPLNLNPIGSVLFEIFEPPIFPGGFRPQIGVGH